MANPVKAVPEGYHAITPGLTCKGAGAAIEFYKKAFGAQERMRMTGPHGGVMHAEMSIGDSIFFLSDEMPAMGAVAPTPQGSFGLNLYVEDVDAVFNRAVGAGATVTMPVTDMFWGDRYGKVNDPFGHSWGILTHKEDVAPEEMKRRQEDFFKQMAAGKS